MAGFGEQLRKLRESKNMSIRDYADLIPLSVSYLSEIERGLKPSPGMAMIEKIAEVLDVKPDYFDEYKAEKVREAVIEDPRLALLFRLVTRLSRKEREEVLAFARGMTEKPSEELNDVFDPQVDRLLENIEKSFHVGALDEVKYMDFADTMAMALSSANHFITGRRGTGKTTLLRKAHRESLQRGNLSFYLDAEVHKNLSYPESLIRILEEIFSALGEIITDNLERSGEGFLGQLVGSSGRKKDLENLRKLGEAVNGKVLFLEDLLREYIYHDLPIKGEDAGKRKAVLSESKQERLEKEAINLGLILEGICRVGGQRSALIHIDDFQFLPPGDRRRILDYLHRISKGKRIFLKVSIGDCDKIETPGRFDFINLNFPLEDFRGITRFLEDLLSLHRHDGELRIGNIQALLKGGEVSAALALASGGIPRDFLKIFHRVIRAARSRQGRVRRGVRKIELDDVKTACLEFLVEDKKH